MQLKDGTLLYEGKYQIVRSISSSDFGFTYEAICARTNSRVVVREFFLRKSCERHPYNDEVSASSLEKVELFDKMKRRFVDEARVLFQFNHPNIVHVTDVFLQNSTAYYVMDYVEGLTLQQMVQQRGRLTQREAMSYMNQLCDAIEYVHSKNRLHLDIRPANVIITPDGRVKLMDFGFSKRLDPGDVDPNVSALNVPINSYSPIELSVDSDATITAVSDIYSLGATLYKVLTGNTPPDASILVDYPLGDLPEDISPNIAMAIRKAMSPNKDERPQSVADFRRMLHAPVHAATFANQTNSSTSQQERSTDSNTSQASYNNNRFSSNYGNSNNNDSASVDYDDVTVVIPQHHQGSAMSRIDFQFDSVSNGGDSGVTNSTYLLQGNDADNGTDNRSGSNPSYPGGQSNHHPGSSDSGLIIDSDINDHAGHTHSGQSNGRTNGGASFRSWNASSDTPSGRGVKKGCKPKLVLIISIIVAVLLIGTIAYLAYSYFSAPSAPSGSSAIVEGTPGTSLGNLADNDPKLMGELGGHLWVDLGLPSGTKWATTNVGAEAANDFGGYYAWGETVTKDVYTYDNASSFNKSMGQIEGNLTFDAAAKLWGESWRLPTKEECEELLKNCSCQWVELDGVKGALFTSRKNGQSIFFPAAGFRYGVITSDADTSYVGKEGAYWTGSPLPDDPIQEFAYGLRLYGSSIQSIDDKFHRGAGRSIRAVAK